MRAAVVLLLGLAVLSLAAANDNPFSGFTMKLHGHYCGPNHGDGTYETEPVDALDRACMEHDRCYDANQGGKYLNCKCDADFLKDVKTALPSIDKKLHGTASLISGWFTNSQCSCKRKLKAGGFKWVTLERPTPEDKAKCH
eukprot:tig00020927_g15947.t1